MAHRNHGIRRRFPSTQRRLAGRIRRPSRHPRLASLSWRHPAHRLPHPRLRARHKPRECHHGRNESRPRRLRPVRQRRPRRSSRQSRSPSRHARCGDGHLSLHAWRFRRRHPRNLRDRPHRRRSGLHGWREYERPGRPLPSRRFRSRCLPSQSPQNLLHSAWWRRSRRRPHRRCQAPRTLPSRRPARQQQRRRPRLPIEPRQRKHPRHFLDVYRDDGPPRPARRHGRLDSQRKLHRHPSRKMFPHSLPGKIQSRRSRMHPRFARVETTRRHRGRGCREAPDGFWIPRPDDELAGRWNAHGRTDRERIPRRNGPLLRRHDHDPRRTSRG